MQCPLISMYEVVTFVHLASTWAMFGVIWFVQLIHYPLLAKVGSDNFIEYENSLLNRTSLVVIPLMVAELSSAVIIAGMNVETPLQTLSFINLSLVALIWASTFFIQVPLHNKLTKGFDASAHRSLVLSNWIRTILWTLRGATAMLLIGTI